MINRDIQETFSFKALAVEFKKAVRMDTSRVLANLPAKTMLLDFVNASTPMEESTFKRSFPLLTKKIMDDHNNNPLMFDWYTLALAVDALHGHSVWEPAAVK